MANGKPVAMIFKLLLSPILMSILCLTTPNQPSQWHPRTKSIPYAPSNQLNPHFQLTAAHNYYKTVPNTSRKLLISSVGSMIPLLKHKDFQLNYGASIINQIDLLKQIDVIGWNGILITDLAYKPSSSWGLLLSSKHFSGHQGDEYMGKNQTNRVSEARNEIGFAVYKKFADYLNCQLEAAYDQEYDYDYDNFQGKPWQFTYSVFAQEESQQGWHPFWSATIKNYQEERWLLSYHLMAGYDYYLPSLHKHTRISLSYHNGKIQLMEFSNYRQEYLGIGVQVEL